LRIFFALSGAVVSLFCHGRAFFSLGTVKQGIKP
jgi:hypothetical protein